MFNKAVSVANLAQRNFSASAVSNGRAVKNPQTYVVKKRIPLRAVTVRGQAQLKRYAKAKQQVKIGTTIFDRSMPKMNKDGIPPYLYGESSYFTESNTGLYGGLFPYTVEKEAGTKAKTRVRRLPNVTIKKLYSATLDRSFKLKVVMDVYRDIQKEGGLDQYLTKDTTARIKELGPKGWELRCLVVKQQAKIEELALKDAKKVVLDKSGKKTAVHFELDGHKFKYPKDFIINSIFEIEQINNPNSKLSDINDENLISKMEKYQLPLQFFTVEELTFDIDDIKAQLENAKI